jgi:thiol-disulfide isomerase/thioredoxin
MNRILASAVALSIAATFAQSVPAQQAGSTQQFRPSNRNDGRFEQNGPKPGEPAPDFQRQTLDGKTVRASELWAKKPTLIMTGSYTCPVFRGHVPQLERLAKEFGDRLNFLVLYTTEAHPKGDPSPYSGREWVPGDNERQGVLFPQAKSMSERIAVAKKCAQAMKLDVPVVVDTMDNSAWKAYGSAPNCAYLIGTDGKIAARNGWFNGQAMHAAIEQLLRKFGRQ